MVKPSTRTRVIFVPAFRLTPDVPSHRRATAAACRSAMLHARPGALGVGRRLHLAPQRHVGGSPLTQQTATKPKHRHTAYVTKTNDPYVGSSMKAPPRRRTAKTPMTTQPCHTLGRPQPQP